MLLDLSIEHEFFSLEGIHDMLLVTEDVAVPTGCEVDPLLCTLELLVSAVTISGVSGLVISIY